jgi:putative peptidoglycan lipid II flippase
MHLLLGASGQCAGAVVHTTATHLLIVFALQIPIYGLAVVALGALQAAHRFVGMTLAPLVSSLVLIAAYLVYGWSSGTDAGSISTLDSGQFWVLAGGTTLAVAALLVTLLPSLLRAGYVTRLSLHFPSGIGARARALAAAGVVTVSAQWLAYAFVLRLVNSYGTPGDAVVFLVAWTVFLLPWAVLAFPIAIVSFPSLAALHDADDRTGFATLAALSTRRILLAAGLGAAALVALGPPVADFLLLGAPGPDHTDELSGALAALAPAVVGYALLAHLSRVLYARHRGRMSSSLAVLAWVVVVGVGVVVAPEVGAGNVVVVVAVAVSTGTVVGAAASLLALSLASPAGSLRGIGRAAAATVVGCSLAAVAGRLVVDQFTIGSPLAALLVAAIGGVVVVAIYLGLLRLIDAEDLTGMLRLRRNADSAPQPDPPLG